MNSNSMSELSGFNLIFDATIHKGRLSTIYRAHTKNDEDKIVCVKSKRVTNDTNGDKEAKFLEKLGGIVPALYFYKRTNGFEIIAMEYMGPNLQELFETFEKRFSLSTIALLGLNLLDVLENLHQQGYIHGHLSPRKILTDRNENNNKLYLVGLSQVKKYRADKGQHIKFKDTQKCTNIGNDFASLHGHLGLRLSRRDDIESLAYILLCFNTKGQLFDPKNRSVPDLCKWKLMTPPELMHSKAQIELVQLLSYARSLNFEEEPNYEDIRKVLRNVMYQASGTKLQSSIAYDWHKKQDLIHDDFDLQICHNKKCLKVETPPRFWTIEEDSQEYIESNVLDNRTTCSQSLIDQNMSPHLKVVYKEMHIASKSESEMHPTPKNEAAIGDEDIVQSPEIHSPWNCTEVEEDIISAIEKVRLFEIKKVMGLN